MFEALLKITKLVLSLSVTLTVVGCNSKKNLETQLQATSEALSADRATLEGLEKRLAETPNVFKTSTITSKKIGELKEELKAVEFEIGGLDLRKQQLEKENKAARDAVDAYIGTYQRP